MYSLVILGAQGQVGRALTRFAQESGISYRALARAECDIDDSAALIANIHPGCFVVNCAAYTAVDKAEQEVEQAYRVNAVAVENIAAACRKAGAPLLHISSDYVFEGRHTQPAAEDDPPAPISVYGRSKLAGEFAARSLRPHIVLRTSWVFSETGTNFVKTMLRMARERPQLRVVNDQIGGPTAADDIAAAVLQIVAASEQPNFENWGTYHFSGSPAVSWYDFARAILHNTEVEITPISTEEYPTPAQRPRNSVLDCTRIHRTFGIEQPNWRTSLARVMERLA